MMSSQSYFKQWSRGIIIAGIALILSACGASDSTNNSNAGPYAAFLQDVQLFNQSHPIAIVETTEGTFAIELYETQLPLTVAHFVKLAVNGRYNGSTVYNVLDNFAAYLGDKSGAGTEALDVQSIALETHPDIIHDNEGIVGLVHQSGIQCATSGNKEQCAKDALNSAKTFFYITLAPEPSLNGSYAAFGKVIKGMQIVRALHRGSTITKLVIVAK